jgi:hypothetical protein
MLTPFFTVFFIDLIKFVQYKNDWQFSQSWREFFNSAKIALALCAGSEPSIG